MITVWQNKIGQECKGLGLAQTLYVFKLMDQAKNSGLNPDAGLQSQTAWICHMTLLPLTPNPQFCSDNVFLHKENAAQHYDL